MSKKLYSFFAIIGMAIAIGTAAFTAPKTMKLDNTLEKRWYYMEDNPSNEGEKTSYRLGVPGDICPSEQGVICTIIAPEDGNSGFPDLTDPVVESRKN